MPTYEYRCNACKKRSEIFHSITEKPKRKCPACGKAKLERLISAGAGFLFKGDGFYITDYRSESYKAGQQNEKSQESKPKDSKPDSASTSATEKPVSAASAKADAREPSRKAPKAQASKAPDSGSKPRKSKD